MNSPNEVLLVFFSPDFVKMDFQKSPVQCPKTHESVLLYIKVCYILKGRNTREYFSPDLVKMDFQRSLVLYRSLSSRATHAPL